MTTTDTSATPPPLLPPANVQWLKWIIARNPLYILSALLLLYGVYRLSIDPNVFRAEVAQLFFNFGSFQFYELLLVVTAIFLARKRIWYDASLLVCFENAFMFVPFILISQALLIGNRIATVFCFVGIALALFRFDALRHWIRRINIPRRLLWVGGILLAVNVALPIVIRALHGDTNMVVWEARRASIAFYAWMFGAPLLMAMANLLPRPRQSGEWFLHKGYFPIGSFGVWMLATAVHLYCIDYVYEMKTNASFFAPVLWVAAWTVWNRVNDLIGCEAPAGLKNALLVPSFVVTFLAAISGNWPVFFALSALNTIAYGSLLLRQRNAMAFQLILLSATMVLAGIPAELLHKLSFHFSRVECFGAALSGYILLRALMSLNPKAGLLGAVVAANGIVQLLDPSPFRAHLAAQVGFVFLLAHSLRWVDTDHPGALVLRFMTSLGWFIHSAVWLGNDGETAFWATAAFGCSTLVVYFAMRLIYGFWGPRLVAYAAASVLCIAPALKILPLLRSAPVGLLALAGSFILFAGGTALALTKNRWFKEHIAVHNVER